MREYIAGFKPWHFFALISVAFIVASTFGLHGSSIDMYANPKFFPKSAGITGTLLGQPKDIRSDEWDVHTPAILHQAFRADALSANGSSVGPGASALLLNVPGKFAAMIFRPQFWAFFVLPPEPAFSVYWQSKTLLLLAGLFLVLHLVTRDALLSAGLALSFYFAAHTQWAFSWASALPEMIGSLCLAVALFCQALVAQRRSLILGLAALAGFFAANFAFCAYPPHQIPLVWPSVTVLIWWVATQRAVILDPRFRTWRIAATLLCSAIIVFAMTSFYLDARAEIEIAANTVYPGRRRFDGGGHPLILYLSHFLDFWKTEENGVGFINVCEATGYLWFGPLAILFARDLERGPARTLYFILFGLFVLYLMWVTLPIYKSVGHLLLLDFVGPYRVMPGMGLLNALMLASFLTAYRPDYISSRALWMMGISVTIVCCVIFFLVIQKLPFGLRFRYLAASAIFVAGVLILIRTRRIGWLAAALVIPIALTTVLVNPIGRGLPIITKSELHKFLAGRPDLIRREWIVFSDNFTGPNFFAAHGLDVLDSFKVIPDLERLKKLDPEAKYVQVYNSSGYVLASEQAGPDVVFRSEFTGFFRILVSPNNPMLREIGISAVALKQKPSDEMAKGLKPLSDHAIDGYWLYEHASP